MIEQLGIIPTWQKVVPDQHPQLLPEEIHVWFLPLQLTPLQTNIALNLLSDYQRDKYHRRHTDKLKQTYLAGRYYLLNLLSQYTLTPAHEINLSYSHLNKPYLSSSESCIEFNFSDTSIDGNRKSNSIGVFVFCKNHPIGVDIESLSRSNNFEAIAQSRFTANEQSYVTKSNSTLDKHRCLSIWTRKEAYGKATGQGINFEMNKIDLASPDLFDLKFQDAQHRWRLHQVQPSENLISCIAYQGHQDLNIKAFNSASHIP